jgi:hypothetical protein
MSRDAHDGGVVLFLIAPLQNMRHFVHFMVRASRHSAHKRKRIVKFWRKNRKWRAMSCTCLNHDKTWRSIGSANIDANSGSHRCLYIYNMSYNIYYITSYDLFYMLIPQVRLAHKYPNPPWEMIHPPGGDNPVRI